MTDHRANLEPVCKEKNRNMATYTGNRNMVTESNYQGHIDLKAN